MRPISTVLRCRDGFTLLETLIAMAVVAIGLTALAWAVPGLLSRSDADASATRIAALLLDARDRAMRTGSAVSITLGAGMEPAPALDGKPIDLGPVEVAVEGVRTGFGTAGIAFLPDGTSTGGRIVVRSKGEQRSLEVDWLTGRIRLDP